jgi:hypothetical protein
LFPSRDQLLPGEPEHTRPRNKWLSLQLAVTGSFPTSQLVGIKATWLSYQL